MIKFEKTKKGNNKDFESIYWLTSIQADKQDKIHHHVTLHVKSGMAAKTDGSRLFMACIKQTDIPDGDYEVLSRKRNQVIIEKKESDKKWPDINVVFESLDSKKYPTFSMGMNHDFIGKNVGIFYLNMHEECENGCFPLLNADFVASALNGFEECNVMIKNDESPVFFYDDEFNKAAAIMPMIK